ncbi:myo-inosose-2 dehydratase [Rhizobiales bacterium]|uniref:myo-inosose-2 dehydratase n=1 Tax=Hongsoonwoonella zoysiae TaxID=2821844 RepID=UPI00155FD453|nr:myo-inosose-2 dehydratase [Hongsoonwoonella zoysiae]NRG18248.1 myo-inosose-2 dehydratase [Hongsoonwoonella zoysiae]
MLKARLGIAPIAWWNDDLEELSDDVSLEECLRQASEAGFTGMETGRRFPMNMSELGPILKKYGMSVCGGWFSGLLLDGDIEEEKDRIREQMDFFIAANAPCIVYGETACSIQGDRTKPLAAKPKLSQEEMKAYGRKMTAFAEWCADEGMPLAYHHHMAAAIETEPELDLFLSRTGEAVKLLYDAGHMAMAGGDVIRVINHHHRRISHVHTKDVRMSVVNGLDRSKDSFLDAVVKGVFTVPGDGDLDFGRIVHRLASFGYQGWFVVEAEQDPKISPPFQMAQIGYKELLRVVDAAEYTVISG